MLAATDPRELHLHRVPSIALGSPALGDENVAGTQNLYSAQLFDKAMEDVPDLYQQFERGEFAALKTWLNENVHSHGRRYRAAELCEHVTGKPLSADPLMRHLEGTLRPIYGL